MFCQNCGKEVANDDRFCAHCGWPVEQEESPAQADYTAAPDYGKTEPVYGATEPVQEEAPVYGAAEPVQEEAPVYGATEPVQEAAGTYGATEPVYGAAAGYTADYNDTGDNSAAQGGSKLPQKKLGLIIGAAAVVVLLIIVAFSSKTLANGLKKAFSSPEKYYQYVEKKNLKETAENISVIYDNVFMRNSNVTDTSVSSEISIALEEEAFEQLEEWADIDKDDISWLSEASITVDYSMKNNAISGSAGVNLGKESILAADIVMDLEEEAAYAQVSSLSEKYLGLEFSALEDMTGEDISGEDIQEALQSLEDFYEKCPDKKKVNKILYNYFCTAIAGLEDVEEDKKEVRAAGISQKVTVLEVTIDDRAVKTIVESVLEEMQKDKDLKKIYEDLAEAQLMEDAYVFEEDYEDLIEEALDSVDYIEFEEEIVMEVYVNGKGEIIGRKFELEDAGEILFLKTKDGKKYGQEWSLDMGYSKVYLEGSGKESGSKLSGEYEIGMESYGEGYELKFTVEDWDQDSIKEGYVNGTINISMRDVVDMLEDELGIPGSMFASYELEVELASKEDSGEAAIRLIYDDECVATINVIGSVGKGQKASAPADKDVIFIEEEDDVMDWVDSIDGEGFLDRLEKAGVPGDYVEELEMMLDLYGLL